MRQAENVFSRNKYLKNKKILLGHILKNELNQELFNAPLDKFILKEN